MVDSAWSGKPSFASLPSRKGKQLIARNRDRFKNRRITKEGFPVPFSQFTASEVEAYFSDDFIVCLLCGKTYRSLGGHLRIHTISEEEYKKGYGLPWRKGLAGRLAHKARVKATREQLEKDDHLSRVRTPETIAKAHSAKRRPRQNFKTELTIDQALKLRGLNTAFGAETVTLILKRMGEGRTLREVFKDNDTPSYPWWRQRLIDYPEDRKRFLEAFDALPFHLQARQQMGMGPRFIQEARKLRASGLSYLKIGKALGIDTMTVFNALRKAGVAEEGKPD